MISIEQNHLLIKQIDASFHQFSGDNLYCPEAVIHRHKWLHEEAPYSILAHNNENDPHFIYANKCALSCFKYTDEEMLLLPSRLSAGVQDRSERERILKSVAQNGIAYDYFGSRVDKYGLNFRIFDGIIWQLQHDNGDVWGQAALFWKEPDERPDWF